MNANPLRLRHLHNTTPLAVCLAVAVGLVPSGVGGCKAPSDPEQQSAPSDPAPDEPPAPTAPAADARPVIVVQVAAPPSVDPSTEALETAIAVPLEHALAGLQGIDEMLTDITADIVEVRISVAADAEPNDVADRVRGAVQSVVSVLPDDARPTVRVVEPDTHLWLFELHAPTPDALAVEADRAADQLRRVAGVEQVAWCGRRPAVEVRLDLARAYALELSPTDVAATLAAALEPDLDRMTPPEIGRLDDLGRTVLDTTTSNAPRLADVAVIQLVDEPTGCTWLPAAPHEDARGALVIALDAEASVEALDEAARDAGLVDRGAIGPRGLDAAGVAASIGDRVRRRDAIREAAGAAHDLLVLEPGVVAELRGAPAASEVSVVVEAVRGEAPAETLRTRLDAAPALQAVPAFEAAASVVVPRTAQTGADALRARFEAMPHVGGVVVEDMDTAPHLRVELDRVRAAMLAVDVEHLIRTRVLTTRGLELGELADRPGRPVPVRLVLDGVDPDDEEGAWLDLQIATADGAPVTLRSVARFVRVEMPTSIWRHAGARVAVVRVYPVAAITADSLDEGDGELRSLP